MHKLLENKVAIVTGASSGIGEAAARLFAQHGAAVVAGARRKAQLDALVADIRHAGGTAIAVAGDLRGDAAAKALVECARDEYGGLDIAFNNAGTLGAMAETADLSPDAWRDTLDANLTSAFLCARHQIPAMLERGGGSLVFTARFVGRTAAFPQTAAYAASKAGLIALSDTLAVEYGTRGIRCNALLHGATDTAAFRQFASDEQSRAFVAGLYALKRVADPDEIAQAALFLASDMSSFVTGSAMAVDGGVSINRT